MRVRAYAPEDESEFRQIHHRQNLGYGWPDLDTPLMLVKLTVVDETGTPRVAGFVRLTAEAFIVVDESLSPEQKEEAFKALLTEGEARLYRAGVDEYHAFIPPKMNGMGRLLCEKYGFVPDEWPSVFKQLGEANGPQGKKSPTD